MPTIGAKPAVAPRPEVRRSFSQRFGDFWDRITEGMEIDQLWAQFKEDAKFGYRLYSKDLPERQAGAGRKRRFLDAISGFFWAVMNKLSPAKRLLLLASVVLVIIPSFTVRAESGTNINGDALHVWGAIGLFLLLLMEIADRITMKRDLEIAREIQTWLVPERAPDVPGLDIAFFNRPANTVAGDYYDVFAREEGSGGAGKYLVAVADVAGKSLPAALLMATFQASLKTQSSSSCDLVNLAACVNRYACEHSRNGQRFTTAVVAEFDPATRTLEYVNAGHNSPLLLKTTGELIRLESGGLPFGIMRDTVYGSARVALSPGDTLLIFTDGLVEAVNERDQEYEEERVIAQLRSLTGLNAMTALRALTNDLQRFTGMARQHDDITCVLIRCAQ